MELAAGVPFVSDAQLESAMQQAGFNQKTTRAVLDVNEQARLDGLRSALALLAIQRDRAVFTRRSRPAARGRECWQRSLADDVWGRSDPALRVDDGATCCHEDEDKKNVPRTSENSRRPRTAGHRSRGTRSRYGCRAIGRSRRKCPGMDPLRHRESFFSRIDQPVWNGSEISTSRPGGRVSTQISLITGTSGP